MVGFRKLDFKNCLVEGEKEIEMERIPTHRLTLQITDKEWSDSLIPQQQEFPRGISKSTEISYTGRGAQLLKLSPFTVSIGRKLLSRARY